MSNFFVNLSIFRIALPLLLLVAIVFRPSVLSGIYLLFFIILPWVPIPTAVTMSKGSGLYLKIYLACSILTALLQLVFQIVLFSLPPYAHFLENCGMLEKILRHVGFVRLNNISLATALTWLSPEIIMLLSSIIVYSVCNKLSAVEALDDGNSMVNLTTYKPKKRLVKFSTALGKYLSLMSLCIAGILRPSVPGGVYFLVFLSAATWWASYRDLHRGFAILLRCVLVLVVIHFTVLYAYQLQWPQEFLDGNSTYARYFGLTPLMQVTCKDPRDIIWIDTEWASFLNPVMLLWLYYILALESKLLLMPQKRKKQGAFSRLESSIGGSGREIPQRLSNRHLVRSATTRHRWQDATRKVRVMNEKGKTSEKTPLIRGVSPSRKYGAGKKISIVQDSTGSVTVASEGQDDIPLEPLGKGLPDGEEDQPTLIDNILFGLEYIVQVLIRSSYIITNIIMMAWSITFHSWITFVLLIWANILWIVPKQRQSMLRSSPLLVFYAWFLLISGYIYSMNLTDTELPRSIDNVDLGLIGFVKVTELPCNFLFVKCLYTSMFWITLRQFMKERKEARQTSALADMVSPLQVTVGTATGIPADEEKGNETLKLFGKFVRNILMRFWIWVVAITLFAVAFTGERMTGFRIIYMALFLIFILSFQLSFIVWRRIMFGFWLTVILYSMLILVLVYTYQFPNIRSCWTDYLHVTETQQLDIGLEDYGPKQLFIRLVTPTFFVIITVIQLHYFHKDFMEISEPKSVSVGPVSDGSSAQGGAIEQPSEKTDIDSLSYKMDTSEMGTTSIAQLRISLQRFLKHFHQVLNLIFIYLELHLPKIVLLLAMCLCIYDKCAIHFIVVLLIVPSLMFGRPFYLFTIYTTSILVSVMVLARMLYQIQYVDHDYWNVTCTNYINNSSNNLYEFNNAEWLGFKKSDANTSFPKLVEWNIIVILAVTLWRVVLVRQSNYRLAKGKPHTRPYFMFKNTTRINADKNIASCVKYLFNFGYYKFGLEICFIATVAVIGLRLDIYAVLYSIWLCILVSLSRRFVVMVWPFYLTFIAFVIPLQYAMVIGLPPSLCIDYPWDTNTVLRRLQEWAFLTDIHYPLHSYKIIFDFILLLLVSRQALVFRIEAKHAGREYPGGSNNKVIHHADEPNFVNPLPDFITYSRSYLDIFKRAIFLSHMWVALAILFLAGANRVNVFSIGYLIGSFVFLWLGSDLYLRPIPNIIRSWNWLLGYNVVVIFVKTLLELAGCLYIDILRLKACWFVQLMAIGCVNRYNYITKEVETKDYDKCTVNYEHINLAWDGLCFAFLLLQRRIFHSYYFFHVIDETKATTILASRGADLIEDLRNKRIKQQEEEERNVLEKIKAKMDRIKATQQKIQGPNYRETDNHFVARPPLARSTSSSSCASAMSQQTPPAGYHTPIDDDEIAPLTPRAGSLLRTQVASPFSAINPGSLDAYLDPQRMSFSSPPNSELNPRPPSPDDSFPVFSPPPYEAAPPYTEAISEAPTAPLVTRQSSIGPPWMHGSLVTPRQSVISYSSRSPLSHHTYGLFNRPRYQRHIPKTNKEAIRSGDYYMFDELDDDEELELIEESRVDIVDPDEVDSADKRHTTIGEFISAAMKSRRLSEPLARRRSTLSARSHVSARTPFSIAHSAPPTVHTEEPEEISKEIEPKAGTSKDEDFSDISEPREPTLYEKIVNYFRFFWSFLESSMVSVTIFLNKYSRDYRFILRVLNKEKKLLKERTNYGQGLRMGRANVWQPSGSYHNLLKQSSLIQDLPSTDEKLHENDQESDSYSQVSPSDIRSHQEHPHLTYEEEAGELSSVDQPPIIRMLLAMWYIVLSHSNILCYFMIFLNQIQSGTFLSLPLPMMVFFWGTLTLPRPSKTFWVTIIAYTEVIVLIKCVFQFEILPWNIKQSVSPFYPPRIIGVEKKQLYALWDLLLLLIVFFHRYLLKCLGLWKSTYVPAVILADGTYRITEAELLRIEEGDSSTLKRRFLYYPRIFRSYSSPYAGYYLSQRPFHAHPRERNFPNFLHAFTNTIYKLQGSLGDGSLKSKDQTAATTEAGDLEELVEASDENTEQTETMDDPLVEVKTEAIHMCSNFNASISMGVKQYAGEVKLFFKELLDPTLRLADDVYSYMFLCDFFNFFVILIGYSSFGVQQGDEGVSEYLEDNRVPSLFLLMLILQFALIIIDRAIFLRKHIFGKLVFQILQIILLHIWLFILYPLLTDRSFNSVVPPKMYYMVKCFYLLLSAYQIRSGYPTRVLGNFICKGYSYLNWFLFKAFLAIPFLYELRTVMDWMWTDTSMTMFDWVKMEDIFAHIYQIKCSRHVESEYPQPRGMKKSPTIKYLMGGAALALMIAIIWFPLVFFSLGNAVGKPNIPKDITLDLRIGPYQPIYQMTVQSNSIFAFRDIDLQNTMSVYEENKGAITFISNYEAKDIAAVKFSTDSSTVWSISPPDRKRLIDEIVNAQMVTVRLGYEISHESSTKEDTGIVKGDIKLDLPKISNGIPNPLRQQLFNVLNNSASSIPIVLPHLFPKFLKVTNKGTTKTVSSLMHNIGSQKDLSLRNVTLEHEEEEVIAGQISREWWVVREIMNDTNYVDYLQKLPYADNRYLVMYTFNDKVFPSTLSFITAGGIIGVYTTIVLVAGRLLRGFLSGMAFKIMFEDLPNADRILQLCYDVYLVREAGELTLEEDLFAKLVFLFRSPETLIKWTRPKEEVNDDEEGDGQQQPQQ